VNSESDKLWGSRPRLTVLPLMIPVVAIKKRRPLVCFDIHLRADISVYVHPPKKNTTVVVLSFRAAEIVSSRATPVLITHFVQPACLISA